MSANERHSDPDGCFSCHVLEGLQFIDEDGLLRVSSIKQSHYYSSLHGSVPCKDCHRKITNYPHEVENGYVDCAETCHVNEPSEGEAYTHKPIVEEFEKSAHGEGLIKDFAGGNRLKEELEEQNPSCRKCHSNTAYIAEAQMELFKDAFMHTETECGTCHQGDVWRDQFGGHILRRLIGSRWKKQGNNKLCIDCHGDTERMAKVKLEDPDTKEKHDADYRWIHAHESYARSLHSRLLVTEIEEGASCMDCHAPTTMGEFRHDILRDEKPQSSTHPDNLAKTCAQSRCHEFAENSLNAGFVNTDLHDIDQVKIRDWMDMVDGERLESNWQMAIFPLALFAMIFVFGCVIWLFKGIKDKKQNPLFGDELFEKIIIGRKGKKGGKKGAKKAPARKRAAPAKKAVGTETGEAEVTKPRARRTAKPRVKPASAESAQVDGTVQDKASDKATTETKNAVSPESGQQIDPKTAPTAQPSEKSATELSKSADTGFQESSKDPVLADVKLEAEKPDSEGNAEKIPGTSGPEKAADEKASVANTSQVEGNPGTENEPSAAKKFADKDNTSGVPSKTSEQEQSNDNDKGDKSS